ncbi:MAG: hypothetical protein QW515_05240 [Thermoplasmatales archaeon]
MNCPPAPRKTQPAQSRLRRFVFTLNKYTEEEYQWLTQNFAPQVKWIIIGKEIGSNGTPHLQGACIIGNQMTFSRLKNLPGLKRAHIEPMLGRPLDSAAYCSKEDQNPFIKGDLPAEGKRNDLINVASRIRSGETLQDLAQEDAGAAVVVKYYRGLTVLRSLTRGPRDITKPPCVIWLYGPTGVGKTKTAFSVCLELAKEIGNIWLSSGGLQWFDGYDGQQFAIFDDFRAKHAPDFSFLLRITDRYPIRVPIKGAFVEWSPSIIIFTCPKSPEDCFATRLEHRPEDVNQLLRRIRAVRWFQDIGDETEELRRHLDVKKIIIDSEVLANHQEQSNELSSDTNEGEILNDSQ